jgi:type II secretory pathway component PulF
VNNIKYKRTKTYKERTIFVISIIFFITSILTKIHNTSTILKQNKNNERKVILNNPKQHAYEKEIKKHTEKINYILKISDTLGESLNYIQLNYKNGSNLQVKTVLKDSIEGANSINSALEPMYSDLDNKNIKIETNNLEYLLNELMHALDENNIEMVENIIKSIRSNEYDRWKRDIENEFN